MELELERSWEVALKNELQKPYVKELFEIVERSYLNETVYPPQNLIFKALNLCPIDKVKVVILGQDPYHGENQAHGLSFSVPEGEKIPPSLKNIYKEINSDLDKPVPETGNLENWAKQGVLLLNATLTVEAGKAGSHQKLGWEIFTDSIIKLVSEEKENIVFLLWGKYAQAKADLINKNKHLILKAPHPSPFSAHTGFLGCRHFSKTNEYLTKHNLKKIDW